MEKDRIQTTTSSSSTTATTTNNPTSQLVHARVLCAVCNAPAIGRNFDAMTCLSCKAFFRRNAYNDQLTFTCRLTSSCEITFSTRRHCSACRLKKCFDKGMKKELIRSINAINNATTAAINNLSQRQLLRPTTMNFPGDTELYALSIDDWTLITNIRNAYDQYCVQKFHQSHQTIPLIPPIQPYRSRLKIHRLLELNYKYVMIIASFLRRILQFEILPSISSTNPQLIIKDNIQTLFYVNVSELMKSKILEHFPWEHDRLAMQSFLSDEILHRAENLINKFQNLLPYDPIIMKLCLIILALSSRICPVVRQEQYQTKDFEPLPSNLLQSQNHYLTLLWKYVIYRLGYTDAIRFLVRFIQNFLLSQNLDGDIIETVQHRNDYSQLVEYNQNNFNY